MAGRSRTVTFDGAAKDPASLSIELPGDRTSTRQELALPKAKHDGWRWLRILQAAATTRRDGEQIEYLWKFAHRSSTGREDTYEATIRLLAPAPTPYEPGFFPRAFEPTPYEAR
jgi:hypothetical protein